MTFLAFLYVGGLLAKFDSPSLRALRLVLIPFLPRYTLRWALFPPTALGIAKQNFIIPALSMVGTARVGSILNKLYSPDIVYRQFHLSAGAFQGAENGY